MEMKTNNEKTSLWTRKQAFLDSVRELARKEGVEAMESDGTLILKKPELV